jgi:hypothetical protein
LTQGLYQSIGYIHGLFGYLCLRSNTFLLRRFYGSEISIGLLVISN